MKRTVTVLQDDIDHGQRKEPYRCAIALAVKRDLADLLGEHGVGGVGGGGIVTLYRFCCDGRASGEVANGQAPAEAVVFLRLFDAALRVEPFKFDIELEFR